MDNQQVVERAIRTAGTSAAFAGTPAKTSGRKLIPSDTVKLLEAKVDGIYYNVEAILKLTPDQLLNAVKRL